MVRITCSILILLFGPQLIEAASAQATQNDRLRARIVLVIREGTEPQSNYKERLGSVATRTEKFFAEWMEHWERPIERTEFFERDADGNVQVTLTKARLPKADGRNTLPELRRQAIAKAKKQLKIKDNRKVLWWIFYDYPGVKGFRGGGNSNYGTAINAYPGGSGLIDQDADLAASKSSGTKIKGMIHEFGHALGLPHNGPRMELDLGNSLMGPISPKFAKTTNSKDGRVYLNEVSAALLWKHPVFKETKPQKPVQPKRIKMTDLEAVEDSDGNIVVSGTLDSDLRAHSAVIFNAEGGKFGDNYWARSHVAPIEDNGQFSIPFESPYSKGKLFLSFCFENGVNTADGKKQTLQKSVVEITYNGKKGRRKFVLPSSK